VHLIFAALYIISCLIIKCKSPVVHTHINGDTQWLTHRKQQKS